MRFLSKFGGFNNPEYGFALDRITQLTENTGKTFFFDNDDIISDFRRSIDFRIAGVNKLSIENDGSMLVGSGANPSFQINPQTVNFGGALNIDYYTHVGQTAGYNAYEQYQSGGGDYCGVIYNALNVATIEMSANGNTGVATVATYQGLFGTAGPTELRLGEWAGESGLGTGGFLNAITFYFNAAEEARIAPNLMTFNNGAVDTQIDWATSGELGFQVALADILRLTASQVRALRSVYIPSDTNSLYLGAGTDVRFYYDGTDLRLITDLIAASDFLIDCGTQKTVELVETVWDDYNSGGFPSSASNREEFKDTTGADTGIETYVLDIGETVMGSFELEHSYKEGTDIYFHIHWQGDTAPTGTDYVRFELTYTFGKTGEDPAAPTTIAVETAYDNAYEFVVSEFAGITGTDLDIGDQFLFKIERVTAVGDAYSGKVLLATVGLHVEINTMGSRQRFIK